MPKQEKSPPSYYDELVELYKKPSYSILSTSKFVEKVRKTHPHIPTKQIKDFAKNQTLQQTYTTQKFKGYYKIVAYPKTFQIDIFFKDDLPFLIFVDVLSRKVFIERLKSRNIDVIIEGIKTLMDRTGRPYAIQSDDEFNKASIKELFEKNDIQYDSVVSKTEHLSKGNKLGIVDTAVRTLKKLINKYMDLTDNPLWEKAIDEILEVYNTTPHSTLKGKTPEDVYGDAKLQAKIYKQGREANTKLESSIDLDIGDFVRKSLDKSKFEKEKAKYSKEIYVIYDKVGYKYQLLDSTGNIEDRLYKYSQLLKVDPTKVKAFSVVDALDKIYRPKASKKRKVEVEAQESEVDQARRIYKKAKRTMRRLKKEGIEVDEVVLRQKRKGDIIIEEESIADRVVKRRIKNIAKK